MSRTLKRWGTAIVAATTLAMGSVAALGGTAHHIGDAAAMRLVATKVDR